MPINIFIIYAREDKEIKQRLLLHLNPLKNEFNAVIWHDEYIEAGQQWKPHIESKLEQTDLFLLLVSVDFMNSEFINQVEFKYAVDRHKDNKSIIVPIIIKFCQWKIGIHFEDETIKLSDFQVLPPDARPIDDWKTADQAYSEIAAGITTVLSTIKKGREEKLRDKENHDIEIEKKSKGIEEKQIGIDQKTNQALERERGKADMEIARKKKLEKQKEEQTEKGEKEKTPDLNMLKLKTKSSKVPLIIGACLVVLFIILFGIFKKEKEPVEGITDTVIINSDSSEQQTWNSALTENTLKSYKAYQRDYQNGKYYNKAQERITQLEAKRPLLGGLYPQASERILSESDFNGLNKWDIKIMRNEIFARHNYIFKTTDMKNYFQQQPWYQGLYNDVTKQLSPIERINVAFIKTYYEK
jgi:hypothetical protein